MSSMNVLTATPHGSTTETIGPGDIGAFHCVVVGCRVIVSEPPPAVVVGAGSAGWKSLPVPLKSLDCLTNVVQATAQLPATGVVTATVTVSVAPGVMPLPVGPVLVTSTFPPAAAAWNVATLVLIEPRVKPAGTTTRLDPNACGLCGSLVSAKAKLYAVPAASGPVTASPLGVVI